MKRPFLLVVVIAALAAFALGVAQADGPGGSSEHHAACAYPDDPNTPEDESRVDNLGPGTDESDCPSGSSGTTVYDNDVTCGDNNDVGGFDVSLSSGGAEICNDGGAGGAPQGRIMAGGDPANQSGFVGADGDKDNTPDQAQGWFGLSSESGTPIACADADGRHDLSHATSDDDINDCMP